MDGADRGEVAFGRIVRTFGIADIGRKFRNQKIQVRIALPVRMGRLIDGYLIDEGGKISAMI